MIQHRQSSFDIGRTTNAIYASLSSITGLPQAEEVKNVSRYHYHRFIGILVKLWSEGMDNI
jgi:hypothetical protein